MQTKPHYIIIKLTFNLRLAWILCVRFVKTCLTRTYAFLFDTHVSKCAEARIELPTQYTSKPRKKLFTKFSLVLFFGMGNPMWIITRYLAVMIDETNLLTITLKPNAYALYLHIGRSFWGVKTSVWGSG